MDAQQQQILRRNFFVERAVIEAKKSPMDQRLGAVVVRQNKVIAAAHNEYVPMSWTTQNKCFSIHAEAGALHQLKGLSRKYLSDCEMYVVRIGTAYMNYPLKLSKPCSKCTRCIESMGIRRVYYSTNEEFEESYIKMKFSEEYRRRAQLETAAC